MTILLNIILSAICWCSPTGLEMGPDGRLLLAYEARETGNESTFIALSAAAPDAERWSPAGSIASSGGSLSDAVLWRGMRGELRMFYSEALPGQAPALMCSVLGNDGWSKAERIAEGRVSSRPVMLRSGLLVVALQKPDGSIGTLLSMDRGSSWMPGPGSITLTEKISDAANRPEIVPHRNGRLSLLSSAHGYQWRYRSVSSDFARSWSEPEPLFANPFQASCVTVLPSGKWLMVKNGKLDQRLFYVPDCLYAYLSDDEGATWYGGMRLDDRTDAVNPVVCAPGNGNVYIAWAYSPEDGHAAEIKLCRTSEAEIGMSTLPKALSPSWCTTAVDANKEAGKVFGDWYARATSSKGSWAKETIRVCSYNIELRNNKPGVPAWEYRLDYVDWLFREYDFDVVGVQEPWPPEYADLQRRLGDKWDSIVEFTRLDTGFGNSIFWKRDRVEKLDDGMFWYGELPADATGFGGSSPRLCIWAKFRDRRTGKIFFNFNSHFDFISLEASVVSSRLLLNKVREIAGDYPVFLTGDFNCSDGSPAMVLLAECGWLADSKVRAEKTENAEYSTVRRYVEFDKIDKNKYQIDHIYYSTGKTKVKFWKLIMDEHGGLRGGSDHMPIYIDWLISN